MERKPNLVSFNLLKWICFYFFIKLLLIKIESFNAYMHIGLLPFAQYSYFTLTYLFN